MTVDMCSGVDDAVLANICTFTIYFQLLGLSAIDKDKFRNVQIWHSSLMYLRVFQHGANRERREVAEVDTSYVKPSAAGVHNENSDDIWSICTYSHTRGLCYAMHVRKYILLANICNAK